MHCYLCYPLVFSQTVAPLERRGNITTLPALPHETPSVAMEPQRVTVKCSCLSSCGYKRAGIININIINNFLIGNSTPTSIPFQRKKCFATHDSNALAMDASHCIQNPVKTKDATVEKTLGKGFLFICRSSFKIESHFISLK